MGKRLKWAHGLLISIPICLLTSPLRPALHPTSRAALCSASRHPTISSTYPTPPPPKHWSATYSVPLNSTVSLGLYHITATSKQPLLLGIRCSNNTGCLGFDLAESKSAFGCLFSERLNFKRVAWWLNSPQEMLSHPLPGGMEVRGWSGALRGCALYSLPCDLLFKGRQLELSTGWCWGEDLPPLLFPTSLLLKLIVSLASFWCPLHDRCLHDNESVGFCLCLLPT